MSPVRFLLLLPVLLLASCSLHLPAPEVAVQRVETARTAELPARGSRDTVPLYLLSDNLHTGLVFDLKWLEESGFVKPDGVGNPRYVTMSWGERTAYVQERWLTPYQVFRALFTPSPSVMEIIPIDWRVEEVCHHQDVYVVDVPRSAGPSLAAFLNGCGLRGADGKPETIGPSSWGDGRLIRCPENYAYYFPRICNVWTAQSLQHCGYEINTVRALSASGLVRQAVRPKNGFRQVWDRDKQQRIGPIIP